MGDSDKTVTERIILLSRLVNKGERDARKFDDGNESAGVRLRKHLQKIKNECMSIRKEVQFVRDIRRKVKDETGNKRRKPIEALKVRWSSNRKKKRKQKNL